MGARGLNPEREIWPRTKNTLNWEGGGAMTRGKQVFGRTEWIKHSIVAL